MGTVKQKQLEFFYQNVRGLRTKTNTFYNNMLLSDCDIALFTETWLCDGILDSELCDSRYNVFRRDRGALGGGVMALCASHLQVRVRLEWDRPELECLWLTIMGKSIGCSKDLHLAVVYIPPNSNTALRLQQFMDILDHVSSTNTNDLILLAGDFNLPCIDWSSGEPLVVKQGSVELQDCSTEFLNFTSYIGLNQCNMIKNHHHSTLDLIFSNFSLELQRSDCPTVSEDKYHPSLILNTVDIFISPFKPKSRTQYNFRKANFDEINNTFMKMDWSFISEIEDLELVITKFYTILREIIDEFVPKIQISGSRSYPVWYNSALIHLIKEKARLHKNWKCHGNPLDYLEFSKLRSRMKTMQESCYKLFIEKSQEQIKSNPKAFWSYVKSQKNCNSNYPNSMTYDDKTFNNEPDICNAFNDFFQKNFKEPASHYPIVSDNDTSTNHVLHNVEITSSYIFKLLKQLDIKKGAGSDGIPPSFFYFCSKTLAAPIAQIFNRCLSVGYFPNIWKTAHIVPIYKKGSQSQVKNYRPISILNVLSKLFERVVHNHMYPIVSKFIPPEQHGFMKERSTNTNLALFTDDVLNGMDGASQVDVIYTDFEKAFDRVDHVLLLRKLWELGIKGSLHRWFESYLRNRCQAVVIGGYCSSYIKIVSGVPQGSILGPLLYACYLYDISKCFKFAKFLMYADDTKIYMNIKNIQDCYHLQEDLNRLCIYYDENRININVSKCSYMSFTRKMKPLKFNYNIYSLPLIETKQVRDLGILLDSKLTFTDHIDNVVSKAFRNLGFILRVSRPFTDIHCLKVLYYTYVRSVLEYCCSIWNPQYLTYIKNIEKIQKKFLKHLSYRDHRAFTDYIDSCNFYHLLTLENRRHLVDMLFLYKICNGKIDSIELVSKILNLCAPSTRTRHTKLFNCKFVRSNYAQNSIIYRLQKTYNNRFDSTDIFCSSLSI